MIMMDLLSTMRSSKRTREQKRKEKRRAKATLASEIRNDLRDYLYGHSNKKIDNHFDDADCPSHDDGHNSRGVFTCYQPARVSGLELHKVEPGSEIYQYDQKGLVYKNTP